MFAFCPANTFKNCREKLFHISPTLNKQKISMNKMVHDPTLNRFDACSYTIAVPLGSFTDDSKIKVKFTKLEKV